MCLVLNAMVTSFFIASHRAGGLQEVQKVHSTRTDALNPTTIQLSLLFRIDVKYYRFGRILADAGETIPQRPINIPNPNRAIWLQGKVTRLSVQVQHRLERHQTWPTAYHPKGSRPVPWEEGWRSKALLARSMPSGERASGLITA